MNESVADEEEGKEEDVIADAGARPQGRLLILLAIDDFILELTNIFIK